MKLKTTQIDGKTYAEVDTQGLPVYVHDDGKEVGFDAGSAMQKISSLNAEAKTHREAKEQALAQLKNFEGIEDPSAAKKALETLKNFDDKKLVDAGEVEKIKLEAIKAVEEKYAPVVQKLEKVENDYHKELIGGGFSRSKFIQEKIAVPVDMVQATFGNNFKIEDGKVVAYGADGQKIYSRSKPGEVADFDEALETLVGGYQYKDSILKGNQSQGGGYQGGGGSHNSAPKSLADCKTKEEKIAYMKQVGEQA
ncbi:DUF6651 domain-containing protein [Acinetobacter sp. Ver3]|uniref:DUF6651 domain-containing protein n=1 Tax=Acinetobacter sp. Ver3 TaxID=466088 RepID=UPI000451B201|nr:DUF6651 domain-containing protein [Acinetobacter sp. Ver3]EZQ10745.1 hypothetical protein CL42_06325 [Acinetobacter sp. Ver3]